MSINEQQVFFRAGVGACIYRANRVLLFHRSNDVGLEFPWQFPQGGLEPHEEPEQAMWRELWEETALSRDMFSAVQAFPQWIGYSYDQDTLHKIQSAGAKNMGQVQRWWFIEMKESITIDLSQAPDQEFDGCEWVDYSEISTRIVPFKRPLYQALVTYFEQYIQEKK